MELLITLMNVYAFYENIHAREISFPRRIKIDFWFRIQEYINKNTAFYSNSTQDFNNIVYLTFLYKTIKITDDLEGGL